MTAPRKPRTSASTSATRQRPLPLPKAAPPPAPPRLIIGIDPATTDGAACLLSCPSSADLAAGARPALLHVWSWRASTAKGAADGVRLASVAIVGEGESLAVKRGGGDGTYPAHAQIGKRLALEADDCRDGIDRVIACERPHVTPKTTSSASQIVWVSGLMVGPVLAGLPRAQIYRPTSRQWRCGLGLDPSEKPTADQIGAMLREGIPAGLASALHGRGAEDAVLPVDVVEAIGIALWAGLTEGRPPRRTAKPRAKKTTGAA